MGNDDWLGALNTGGWAGWGGFYITQNTKFIVNYDLVEMVLADEDSWDRYAAAQWLNIRRFLDANPDAPIADELRDELRAAPHLHVRYQRAWLGWGVFALMPRS